VQAAGGADDDGAGGHGNLHGNGTTLRNTSYGDTRYSDTSGGDTRYSDTSGGGQELRVRR
jgi:hypothetical protein